MSLAASINDDESVITFYDDAGTPNRITASSIAYDSGTQKLTFTPTSLLTANTTYTVTVLSTVTDLTGNAMASDYVFTFTIEPNASIAATSPSDAAQFIPINTNVTVTFAENMDETTVIAGNFALEKLDGQGGSVVGAIAGAFSYNDSSNIITFDPTALLETTNWYRATVDGAMADQTGNPIGSDYTFEFKTEPTPAVSTTTPANNAQFITVDTTAAITFSKGLNLPAIVTDDETVITFYDDAGTPNRVLASGIGYDSGTQRLTFTPANPLSANTTYTVTVLSTVADLTGNSLGSDYVLTFTTEPNPTIAATTPSNTAQFIQVNADVTVMFSEDMDEGTVIAGNWTLEELDGQGGAVVATVTGSFGYNDGTNVLTYNPDGVLKAATWFRATVDQIVADSTGNPLGTDYIFEFKTEPAPTVLTTIPANSSQFITVNVPVTITFSENMNLSDPVADDESVITFYDDAATPNRILSSDIDYDSGTQKLTFTPASLLAANTTYTVTVLSTVTDMTGNPLGSDYVFTFTVIVQRV